MSSPLILDASPLSLLCYPYARRPEVVEVFVWLRTQLANRTMIYLPEIADYEVRRELLRAGKHRSVRELDALRTHLIYLPLDSDTMRRAAEFWAQVRNQGMPTARDGALDADVILAAQAEKVGAVIVTENARHLSRLGPVTSWRTPERGTQP